MAASQQCTEQVELCQPDRRFSALTVFLGAVCFLFLLLFLKRPDALLSAQFFAEDGRIFFHDQLLFGAWEAFSIPYAGYLLFVPRSVAMLASLFPIEAAPTVYNVAALLIAACSCAIFCLPVFRWLIASDVLRFAVCCLIATALDSGEMSGVISQIQWYLQLAGILLVLYSGRTDFPHKPWMDTLLALFLLVISLSVPLMILAVPTAVWIVLRARGMPKLPAVALLLGVIVQLYVYANAGMNRGQSLLFNFHEVIPSTGVYLAFRAVFSSLIGRNPAGALYARGAFVPSLLVGIVVLLWLAWLWRKADPQTRWNMLGVLYFAVASAVLAVGARNLPRSSEAITFGGERYFYLASCCLVLLIAITFERFAWNPWARAAVLAGIFSAGVWGNFKVPAYADFHWDLYCERIAHWEEEVQSAGVVTPISVPLNPVLPQGRWTLVLEGNVLGNGGFEEAYPDPWVGLGNIGMAVRRDYHYQGKGSLIVSGTGGQRGQKRPRVEGDVRQMVWGFKPGDRMRAQAAVLMPCQPDLMGSLLIEDGKGREIAGITNNASSSCGSWRLLEVKFQAPASERVLIRLLYRGAAEVFWDDVKLAPDQ
jgi:hypothetical protein